jgi:hypothetical protein
MKTIEATDGQKALRGLGGAMLLGVLSVMIYAAHTGGKEGFLSIASVGILLGGAAGFFGGALGFLFGIPRTLQQETPGSATDGGAGAEGGSAGPRIDYRVNTNLEQISDWLTKILVGVSLTQISEIRSGLVTLTEFAAAGLGPQAQGEVFAFALLSYSAVLGFLFGYLWTRLSLAGALRAADQAAIGNLVAQVQKATQKVESTERKLDELKKQTERDAMALNLAYRQLNPAPDLPQVTQEELDAAVAAASQPVRVQIFNQAWQVRGENWRDADKKPKMERTIPVFSALIRSDGENRYHMNHGQLGFALKDKPRPDWAEAEKELTAAIEIRGPWHEHGWLFYEFNRAVCRIMTDPAFVRGEPSSEARKAAILEDLRVAARAEDVARIVKSDATTQKWMTLNQVTHKDLRGVLPERAGPA